MKSFSLTITIIVYLCCRLSFGQAAGVLQTGHWYKVAVTKDGAYKITADQFKKMGFDISSTDPRNIKIYGVEGGMLPQENDKPWPTNLVELSISVTGEDDGVLNSGDFVLFYAQGPDRIQYNISKAVFEYESNLYSTKNYYFITVGSSVGKRISSNPNLQATGNTITTFNDFVYHELDEYNELKSGREWFGEQFEFTTEYKFQYDIAGIAENTEMKLVSDVMAESFNGSSFSILINGNNIGEQPVAAILNSQYGVRGRHRRDTLTTNANNVGAASISNQEIKYQYTKASSGKSKGFLDFFLWSFKRKLALYKDQTIFRAAESLNNAVSTYQINNVTIDNRLWNITDVYNPTTQETSAIDGGISFTTTSELLKTYIIFNNNVPAPELVKEVANQNLLDAATPNVIIITHPDFKEEAQRLANHRSSYNKLSCVVATTEEIYNEFSSGRQDITALRNFVRYTYNKSPNTLKAVLLFGKGSYDYKDRVNKNTNFVPTYESRNSLSPLETYSSDDYYGFLESDEGMWRESSPVQNHTLDIGIGRLPVKTKAEASAVVDKIIYYDVDKTNFGAWRKDIVFVADDGSLSDGFTSIHQSQANTMAKVIEGEHPEFNTKKIFLGTYQKSVAPNGETIPRVTEDLIKAFDRGALIINYTGHGNEKQWADENVFNDQTIASLENKHYPFLVTATCEFGRNDEPTVISSAELSVIHPQGGSIGLVTTARPVNSSTNFSLNQAFYEALFEKETNQYLTLGEVFRRTKNNSTSGVSNRNFILLADPSQTLALPSLKIVATKIKTSSDSDTLKALSTVVVQGEVQDAEGQVVSSFDGTLHATLFDKQTSFVTIGKNSSFSFKQWFNPLFKGKAFVNAGKFEFNFILPKNISYEVDSGKLSLYAVDENNLRDASGASSSFKIGLSETDIDDDITQPKVSMFMGDTTFINGGIVSANTTLIVRLEDNSGINISNYGIGNNMIAVLDNDKEVFILNDFYEADANNFRKGWVLYPLKNLSAGRHSLTVSVWDVYNNPSQASINFIVTDGNNIVIEEFGNYPNPFEEETTLFFTHNRSGDALDVELYLLSSMGEQLKMYTYTIPESAYQVNLLKINALTVLGKKPAEGLYFARLVVRSITNGSKYERVTKLIIVN